jgi:hypothetical protein
MLFSPFFVQHHRCDFFIPKSFDSMLHLEEEKEFYFKATYLGMTCQVRPLLEATIPAPEEVRFWALSRSWAPD